MPDRLTEPSPRPTVGPGVGRRLSRRSVVGAAAASLLLTGCVVETPRQGPLVPTPTAAGISGQAASVDGPAGRWQGRELRVVAPGDDIREALRTVLLEPFAAATGCQLRIGFPAFGDLSTGQSSVDLALVSDRWASQLDAAGALSWLEPIGREEGLSDLIPATATAIPAYGNAIVSAYRNDAVTVGATPVDWAEWWQSQALPGPRTLAKGPYGTFEFSLLADGVNPASLYPIDLNRAIAGLRRISGSIVDRWWETGPQVIDWLSSGRVAFGSAMAHQVVQAQRAGRPVQPVWNQGLLVADYWVVPGGATNADMANDFLRFALSAAAQARLASVASLAPVSSAALDLVDPLLRINLATSPLNLPRLIGSDTQWWVDNATTANEAFNSWLLGDPRSRS